MPPDDVARIYLTSAEATALLGIRIQTLYAYVSKGMIRSVKQVGTKERLYRRDDILRVQARSMARSGHGAVAGAAQHGGQTWNLSLDGNVIQTNAPGGTSYAPYSISFTATATYVGPEFAGGRRHRWGTVGLARAF